MGSMIALVGTPFLALGIIWLLLTWARRRETGNQAKFYHRRPRPRKKIEQPGGNGILTHELCPHATPWH